MLSITDETDVSFKFDVFNIFNVNYLHRKRSLFDKARSTDWPSTELTEHNRFQILELLAAALTISAASSHLILCSLAELEDRVLVTLILMFASLNQEGFRVFKHLINHVLRRVLHKLGTRHSLSVHAGVSCLL